jgi:hypothetical protein
MKETNTLNQESYDEVYNEYCEHLDKMINEVKDERLKSLFNQIRSLEIECLCNSCFDEYVGDSFESENS